MEEVFNNSAVAGLKAELARQEVQLQQVDNRLGEAHPQVRELRSAIADLKAKIATEVSRVTSSIGIANTVNVSRLAQTRAALEEQRAKVLKMKALRDGARCCNETSRTRSGLMRLSWRDWLRQA